MTAPTNNPVGERRDAPPINVPLQDGRYVSSGRILRDSHYDHALSCREHAIKALRLGYRNYHRSWMHEAVREWRKFKYYHRRLANANG